MPRNRTSPPTRRGPVAARAPMVRSGSTTRSMGRRESEASPTSVTGKGAAASRPANRRMVVPELPQSSGPDGSRSPRSPRPATTSPSTSTPRARRQPAVLSTSAPGERPRTRATPSATAFRISARWEMDLSPGTRTSPSRRRGALTVASTTGPSDPWPFGAIAGVPLLDPPLARPPGRLEQGQQRPFVGRLHQLPETGQGLLQRVETTGDRLPVGAHDGRVQRRVAGGQPAQVPEAGTGQAPHVFPIGVVRQRQHEG